MNYLDLSIYKGQRYKSSQILDIKPYFKPTNKFQYLKYNSAHPKGIFTSLVKGELSRLLRASSSEDTYRVVTEKILKAFRERGYPKDTLDKISKQVPFNSRDKLLTGEKKHKQAYDTFLSIKHTPDLDTKAIRQILKPNAQEEKKVPIPCLSMKKTNNLATKLVRAKLKQYPDPPKSESPITIEFTKLPEGNSMPCCNPGCKCCPTMSKKCRVTSSQNYKTYPTQRSTSCSSNNVIYLLECKKCTKGNQYVGQTSRPLRRRIAEHRSASRVKTNLPIYRHFN